MTQRRAGRGLRHLRWPLFLLVAATVGGGALFIAFASEVVERELRPLDTAGRAWVMHLRSGFADAVFGAITWLGSAVVLVPCSAIVAWFLWRRQLRRQIAPVVLAPLAAVFLGDVLKAVFRSARPAGALGHVLGYGFPSGHTTGITAVGLTIAYVLVRERLVPRVALVLALVLAIAVGISRVYLDLHWVSDVLGGWIIGLVVAAACAAAYERARDLA